MLRTMTTSTTSTPAARLASVQRHLSSSSSSPTSPSPAPPSPSKAQRPSPPSASEFNYWLPFQTRFHDNDSYGHLNNVTYSQYFDSITNHFLLTRVPSTPSSPRPLGLIVTSETTYSSSLSYPSPVLAALTVQSLSARSVVWRVALFEGEYVEGGSGLEDVAGEGGKRIRLKGERAAAYGTMTHVFVREDAEGVRRVVEELPEGMRGALEGLLVG